MKTIIESNGSKWMGEGPDSIEKLLEVLKSYTLDPKFEDFGNFVEAPHEVEWLHGKCPAEYEGMTSFFGNFYDVSHVFRIWTNDPDVIEKLTKAIRENQNSFNYQVAAHNTGFDIHSKLVRAGIKTDGHYSDLYCEVTEESERIIDGYKYKGSVTTFTNQIDGKLWFDIPFAFNKMVQKRVTA